MTETWSVVATIERPHIANAAPVHLGRRADGAYCLLVQHGREWRQHGPTITPESALQWAEHVAAGFPRALTAPDMGLALATAVLAFFDVKARNVPPAADLEGEPPPPAAPSASPPVGGAALSPDHPSCMRCGE